MGVGAAIARALALAGVLLSLTGCLPDPAPGAEGSGEPAVMVSVTDGDTIETSAGTVRIIGIDTPERGECGYEAAEEAIGAVLGPGDQLTLELPDGQNDRDAYDRLLRYVGTVDGVDIGLLQLESGNAIARYDSLDGYPWHPREAQYHEAQTAMIGEDGSVLTSDCQ